MENSIYPTGYSNEFASNELIESLASHEESLEYSQWLKEKNLDAEIKTNNDVSHYWFNNSAWSREYPIGLMDKQLAELKDSENKYTSFTDFDDTIPAITKKQYAYFKANY